MPSSIVGMANARILLKAKSVIIAAAVLLKVDLLHSTLKSLSSLNVRRWNRKQDTL
jgi:hypothetical protein